MIGISGVGVGGDPSCCAPINGTWTIPKTGACIWFQDFQNFCSTYDLYVTAEITDDAPNKLLTVTIEVKDGAAVLLRIIQSYVWSPPENCSAWNNLVLDFVEYTTTPELNCTEDNVVVDVTAL